MNPDGANLLSQLRDIHSAPAVPWWPPAPGWWVLAVLVLIGLALLLRHAWKRLGAHKRRRRLLQHLDSLQIELDPEGRPQEYLSSINRLLKLVAIRAFPDQHCASMQGREWTEFLGTKLESRDAALDSLAAGPYQVAPVFDVQALDAGARQWIRRCG